MRESGLRSKTNGAEKKRSRCTGPVAGWTVPMKCSIRTLPPSSPCPPTFPAPLTWRTFSLANTGIWRVQGFRETGEIPPSNEIAPEKAPFLGSAMKAEIALPLLVFRRGITTD